MPKAFQKIERGKTYSMGIYTSNRFFDNGPVYDYAAEIPANEAYNATFGCAQIFADCQRNDMALFESAIFSDMNEVMSLREGVEVVNENAFTDIIKKIVEMFKKLLAKIKGIFNAFLAKLAGAFKNNKDLVKKYEKQILKYTNWKDLKIKGIRKPKSGNTNIQDKVDGIFDITEEVKINYTTVARTDETDWTGVDGFGSNKKVKEAESDELNLAIIKLYLKNVTPTDYKDVAEDIKDYLYDDADTLDGEDDIKSASFFSESWIKGVLTSDKWEKDTKKKLEKLEKKINKIIDRLNKVDDELAKHMLGNDKDNVANLYSRDLGKDDADTSVKASAGVQGVTVSPDHARATNEKYQNSIHTLQTLASHEQEVISKVTSLYMEEIKFATAQARKVWTAGAAWSSGVHKESVEYYNALGECAAKQFYSNMEALG